MKEGYVVYVDSNPTNLVGLFFQQNFPAGKSALQAAQDYAATLSIPSDVKLIKLSSYVLLNETVITL
jgi:hypothetical protein